MEWPNLTQWIACYAALVSTILGVRTFWVERDRLKVAFHHGIRTDIGRAAVVEIRNHSRRTVYLNSVGLIAQYEPAGLWKKLRHAAKYRTLRVGTVGWLYIPLPGWADEHKFPSPLQAGESLMLWLPETAMAGREHDMLIASVQDGLRRETFSNRFRFR
jgi:hypothetical protein